MAWSPIALTVPQYEDSNGNPYSGAVLKAYAAGTSTPISMATDSTGNTTASSIALNASGYPAVSGSIVVPHVAQAYKLALYPTQAAADANSGATWSIDNLSPIGASTGSGLMGWIQSGVGAILRTVLAKLLDAPITPDDFDTVGNGTADDTVNLQKAITAAQTAGRKLVINKPHGVTAQLEITDQVTIEFAPSGQLTALGGFTPVTKSGTDITAVAYMLNISGAGASGTKIKNPQLNGSGIAGGIQTATTTSRVKILDGLITDMNGPGVYTGSNYSKVQGVQFERCGVDSTDTGTVYTSSLRAYAGRGIKFLDNTVLESGGKCIVFSQTTDCVGIGNFAKDPTKTYGSPYYMTAATRCKFIGNVGIQGEAAGTQNVIKISTDCVDCAAEDNTFVQNIDADIIVNEDNLRTVYNNNTLIMNFSTVTGRQAFRNSVAGGTTYSGSEDVSFTNNKVYGQGVGTAFATVSVNPAVTGNTFNNWATGIQTSTTGVSARANCFIDVTNPLDFGGSTIETGNSEYSRLIHKINSDYATDGTAASFSLGDYSLPANWFDRTGIIKVRMAGTKTGSAGNKTISFRLGSTDVAFNAAANDTNDWSCDALIETTLGGGTGAQRISVLGFNGATPVQDYATATENVTTALFIGPRVTIANAGDVVTLKMMTVELIGP